MQNFPHSRHEGKELEGPGSITIPLEILERRNRRPTDNTGNLEQLLLTFAAELSTKENLPENIALDRCLEALGEYCGADLTTIYLYGEKGFTFLLNRACPVHQSLEKDKKPHEVMLEQYPAMNEAIARREIFTIPDANKLPESWAPEKKLLLDLDTHFLHALPIIEQKKLFGYLVFTRRQAAAQEEMGRTEILLFFANIIGQFLARQEADGVRKQAVDQAEHLTAELKKANQGLSSFLSKISHEIRTALNSIIGLSKLLQNSELDLRQHRFARNIESGSKLLLQLSQDILDFSRLKEDKLEIRTNLFTVEEMVGSAITPFIMQAEEKGLSIMRDLSPNVPDELVGDSARIIQILANFINNAVKYSDSGIITVRTRVAKTTPQQLWIAFSVEDTGRGVAEENIGKIFEPFFQGGDESSSFTGGTGLGLAICRQLSLKMGGSIVVESELGRGSIFTMNLPFPRNRHEEISVDLPLEYHPASQTPASRLQKSSSLSEEKKPVQRPVEQKPTAIAGTSRKALVVEDIIINQHIVIQYLTDIDIAAETAISGERALELVQQNTYDFILMDVSLPGIDGIETTRSIRKMDRPQVRDIPIIAMTAHAIEGFREQFNEAGMNAFIRKPIDVEQLYRTIAEYIDLPSKGKHLVRSSGKQPENRPENRPEKQPETFPFLIDGLDTGKGFNRLNQDKELYRKVIREFYQGSSAVASQLSLNWKYHQQGAMIRIVHSQKSIAGSIGATELSDKAKELELLLMERGAESERKISLALADFFALQRRICSGIEESGVLSVVQEDDQPKQNVSREELNELVKELLGLLQVSDFNAIEQLRSQLNAIEVSPAVSRRIEKINHEIENYAYDRAAVFAEEILNLI